MIEVELFDGTVLQFPAGTPQQVIDRVAKQETANRRQPQRSLGETIYENVIGRGEADTPGERLGQLVRGAGAGTMRGAAELVGLPGTLSEYALRGGEAIGLYPQEREPTLIERGLPYVTGEAMRGYLSGLTGGASEYRAPGTAGEYASTIGEFVGGAAGRAPRAMVGAGTASETAGQLTEGTEVEPYARVAGALLGPSAASMIEQRIRRAITPYPGVSGTRLDMAKVLDDFGVPMTAGQRVGSEALRRAEGSTARGQEIVGQQREAFTRAVLGTAGIDATRATPDIIAAGSKKLGDTFDRIFAGTSVVPDATSLTSMSTALQTYRQLSPSQNIPPLFNNINRELVRSFRSGAPIDGNVLKTWRSNLSALTRSNDAATRDAAIAAVDALDDVIAKGLGSAEDVAALNQARQQYRNLLVIERAAARAEEGLLTPAQVRTGLITQGLRSYSQGRRGDIGELARAGQDIIAPLPATSPGGVRSIRELMPIAGAGGGAYLGSAMGPEMSAIGAAIGSQLPGAYNAFRMTPIMQRYLANQAVGAGQPSSFFDLARTVPGLLGTAH